MIKAIVVRLLDTISDAIVVWHYRRMVARLSKLSGKVPDKNYGHDRKLR